MKLSDLDGKRVRRQSGEILGRVREVRVADAKVVALICGAGGFWQRLGPSRKGRRIAWDKVRRVTDGEIWID